MTTIELPTLIAGDHPDCIGGIGWSKMEIDAIRKYATIAIEQDRARTIADYEEVLADHRRLVRELDVIWNGEEGAAKQASLCDLVAQIRQDRARRVSTDPVFTVPTICAECCETVTLEPVIYARCPACSDLHFFGEYDFYEWIIKEQIAAAALLRKAYL